jgi:hypothetical protein
MGALLAYPDLRCLGVSGSAASNRPNTVMKRLLSKPEREFSLLPCTWIFSNHSTYYALLFLNIKVWI